MAIGWKYLYFLSVWLSIVALILTRQHFPWFNFLRPKWNIKSENLPDKAKNLGIFTIWLALSGCPPHMSSLWPWSGTPKVHLYNTFLGSLHQHPLTVPTFQCIIIIRLLPLVHFAPVQMLSSNPFLIYIHILDNARNTLVYESEYWHRTAQNRPKTHQKLVVF